LKTVALISCPLLVKIRLPSFALAAAGLHALLLLPIASFGQARDGMDDLRRQLAAAGKDTSQPGFSWYAVAELSRRILLLDPRNPEIWEKMARAQFEVGDVDRCERTLASWEESLSAHPPVLDALYGDIAFARGDHPKALQFWSTYLAAKPGDAATLEKVAWSQESDGRWNEAIQALTERIAADETPGALVWRARCYLRQRNWDAAFADIKAAGELDPSDDSVKAWLPRFELLRTFLPDIKNMAVPPGTAGANKLLDRALLFGHADQDDLALEDDETALKDAPDSRRALLQKCAALLALNRREDAAKLNLNILVPKRSFAEKALREIGNLDAKIEKEPKEPNGLLVERAVKCNEIDQFTLALQDTATVEGSGVRDALFARALTEEGYALEKLGRKEKGMKRLIEATELDPKNALAWRFRGELEMLRANYPVAVDFFSKSLAIEEVAAVFAERAKCYRATGKSLEANWDIERFKDLQEK